jgi:hypothetical protein
MSHPFSIVLSLPWWLTCSAFSEINQFKSGHDIGAMLQTNFLFHSSEKFGGGIVPSELTRKFVSDPYLHLVWA